MLRLKRSKNGSAGNELRTALGRAELPTIPGVVTRAIEQISAPDCDLSEVGEIMSHDPGLAARLLTTVNSAAYAPRNPVVSVEQATVMLGKNHLESMLISLAASSAVNSVPAPGFNLPRFWRIASWRAMAAAALSRQFDRPRSGENFSASLLEDIAVPLLVAGQPRYATVLADWFAGKGDLAKLETAAFGWTHKTVAGWLCDEWALPPTLAAAVTDSSSWDDPKAPYPVVRVVAALSAPFDYPEVVAITSERISTRFGMSEESAVALLETARRESLALADSLQ